MAHVIFPVCAAIDQNGARNNCHGPPRTDGDKYEGDLKLAVGAVLGVIGTGALAILATSAL